MATFINLPNLLLTVTSVEDALDLERENPDFWIR